MRGATQCARKLKSVLNSLRNKLGKVHAPSTGDPITQLILGVLSRDTPEAKALEGLERLRSLVVDYNELRVIPPIEMADTLTEFPDRRLKCEDISRALNAIFAIEHIVSLDRVVELPSKEALTYLNKIDGLEAYTVARIRLLGLNQPSFPLDEAMFAFVRQAGAVAPKSSHEEAQHFLERQIPHEEALEAYALLRKHAWAECAALVRKGQVERIKSVPPDRTTRNMLQAISAAAASGAAVDELDAALPDEVEFDPDALDPAPEAEEPAGAKKPAKPGKSGGKPGGEPPSRRPARRPAKSKPAPRKSKPPKARPARPARPAAARSARSSSSAAKPATRKGVK
jgi:endonuclease III